MKKNKPFTPDDADRLKRIAATKNTLEANRKRKLRRELEDRRIAKELHLTLDEVKNT